MTTTISSIPNDVLSYCIFPYVGVNSNLPRVSRSWKEHYPVLGLIKNALAYIRCNLSRDDPKGEGKRLEDLFFSIKPDLSGKERYKIIFASLNRQLNDHSFSTIEEGFFLLEGELRVPRLECFKLLTGGKEYIRDNNITEEMDGSKLGRRFRRWLKIEQKNNPPRQNKLFPNVITNPILPDEFLGGAQQLKLDNKELKRLPPEIALINYVYHLTIEDPRTLPDSTVEMPNLTSIYAVNSSSNKYFFPRNKDLSHFAPHLPPAPDLARHLALYPDPINLPSS